MTMSQRIPSIILTSNLETARGRLASCHGTRQANTEGFEAEPEAKSEAGQRQGRGRAEEDHEGSKAEAR